MLRLNIGAGDWKPDGYTTYDLYDATADVKGDARTLPYVDNSVDEILASHLLEHFSFHEAFVVLTEWKRALKPDGKLILEVPNLLETCRMFVAEPTRRLWLLPTIFGYPWVSGQGHLFGYTPEQLEWTLGVVGFRNIIQTLPHRYSDLGVLNMRFECIK